MKTVTHVVLVASLVASLWFAGATAARADSIVAGGRDAHGQVSKVPAGDDFIAISAGAYHCLALKSDGTIVAWGLDTALKPPAGGQVSHAPAGKGFTAVSGGGWHSIAMKSDGSLAAWGWSHMGQVGQRPTTGVFKAISGGDCWSLALRDNGALAAWGAGKYRVRRAGSQRVVIGDGQVGGCPGGNNFTAISAGARHGLALKSNGSVVAWGWNGHGQVSAKPSTSDFKAVAAGYFFCMALESDGSIAAWGHNNKSQISERPTKGVFK